MSTIVPVPVGLNGFGAVGRSVFFASLADPAVAVVAINDVAFSTDYVAYVLQHEAPQYTSLAVRVEVGAGDTLVVNGEKVAVTHAHDYRAIDWGAREVQFVLECSGVSTTRERCWTHINAGAAGVVIAAQSADAAVVVPFINDAALASCLPVVCAGAGVGCVLAPLVHLLDRALGVQEISFTAVHGPQPVDAACGRSSDRREWRQARLTSSGAGAIVPYDHTGVNTLVKVFPQLKDRVAGTALQVPVQKGCAVDLLVRTTAPVLKEQLDELLRQAAGEDDVYGACIEVGSASDLYISTDCLQRSRILYDAQASQSLQGGHTHKLMLWVDMERAYAHRLLMLVKAASAAAAEHKQGN